MKVCTKCHSCKPLTEFSADRNKPSGYGSRCKQCKSEAAKARRAANPEKALEAAQRYRKKHPERTTEARRKCLEANREKYLESSRRWKQKNPEKVLAWVDANRCSERAKVAKRRALIASRTFGSGIHDAEIKTIYGEAVALTMETGVQHHVDHIVPLRGKTVSGLHVPWNLRVIPAQENQRKSNKHTFDTLENHL